LVTLSLPNNPELLTNSSYSLWFSHLILLVVIVGRKKSKSRRQLNIKAAT
jgi:hypothetical protein